MEIRKIGDTEVIEFNGVKYRRYPKSKRRAHRKYFFASGDQPKEIRILHRAVWVFHNGPIPEGYHIHHKNDNWDINEIWNLECKEGRKHNSEHTKKLFKNPEHRRKQKEHLAKIRERAIPASKTPEAERKRRQSIKALGKVTKICEQCGKIFEVAYPQREQARFCSKTCISNWNYKNKTYFETRECLICGEEFKVEKWKETFCCSRKCAAKYRAEKRKCL